MIPAPSPSPHRVDRRGAQAVRGIFTETVMPTLHASTFEVGSRLRESSIEANPVLARFPEQVQIVSVGLKQPLHRAVIEGTDLIVGGAQVMPGFFGPGRRGNGTIHAPWFGERSSPPTGGRPIVTSSSLASTKNPAGAAAPHPRDAVEPVGARSTTFGETSPTTRQE